MGTRANRHLHVVHLVSTLNVGGLEMVVLNLVRQRSSHISARVICLEEAGTLGPQFDAIGVRVEELDQGNLATRVATLARRLRALRPDLVHTHNPSPHLYGAVAATIAGVPAIVHTKHGRNYPEQPARVWLNRQLSRLTDVVVAVSQDVAEVCRTVERVPMHKVRILRNGVDTSGYGAGAEMRCARRSGVRAVCVARLHPVKDHATLLRATRRVVDAAPTFHLDIVGDGVCRRELELLTRELGLERHVTFHGSRADVWAALAAADVFVLSSTTEGVSLTLLEAMSAALPVVATDVGGNSEVVVDGETGLLVPPQRPDALAAALLQVISDSSRRKAMGQAGLERVRKDFELATVVGSYEALYAELLASRPQPARSQHARRGRGHDAQYVQ
jgi:sugar transferase (PEP-CTERM/EpsH1 system associated)